MNNNIYDNVEEKYSKGILYSTLYKYQNTITVKYMHETDNIYIYGSFHKLMNNGKHNYNQFTYHNFLEQLEYLQEIFKIELSNCVIKRLEYGVNITPPDAISKIHKGILLHCNELPLKPRKTDLRFKHSKYELKCYNKSVHYSYLNPLNNIMRFERHFLYASVLHKQDIYTLQDLTNTSLTGLAMSPKFSSTTTSDLVSREHSGQCF